MGIVTASGISSNPADRDRSWAGHFLVDTAATDSLAQGSIWNPSALHPKRNQRTYWPTADQSGWTLQSHELNSRGNSSAAPFCSATRRRTAVRRRGPEVAGYRCRPDAPPAEKAAGRAA